jgi:hypothetical protein
MCQARILLAARKNPIVECGVGKTGRAYGAKHSRPCVMRKPCKFHFINRACGDQFMPDGVMPSSKNLEPLSILKR